MAGMFSITLSVLDEMKNILMEGRREVSFLDKTAKTVYESLVNRVKTALNNGIKIQFTTLKLLSKALLLLFDPERGFVFLTAHIVALLEYFGDSLEGNDIPPTAKSHVALLQLSLTEANKTLQKIEKRISELLEVGFHSVIN